MKAEWQNLRLWGTNGKALIVEPDVGARYVFWEKAQYVPCMELAKDVWFTTEWMETGSVEDRHCYEPIMDKECRYSSVALKEINDVRAVVVWRYALCNPQYEIFHGNTTAEEQYTIFPDGTAVRTLIGWPGAESLGLNPTLWEVGEFILINGIGSTPSNLLQGYSIGNLSGDSFMTSWPPQFRGTSGLCKLQPHTAEWKECIGILHLKNSPDPFVGFSTQQNMFPHSRCSTCGRDHPEIRCYGGNSTFLHWPAYDDTSFAGWIRASEDEVHARPTHTSLFSFGYSYGGHTPPSPSAWFFLVGTSESGDAHELVRSWLRPGRVRTNHLLIGYSTSQRSHALYRKDSSPCEITLASREPVVNPSFRIENSPPPTTLEINGEELDTTRYLAHVNEDKTLLLWVRDRFEGTTKIVIH